MAIQARVIHQARAIQAMTIKNITKNVQCYFEIFSSANGLTYLYHRAFIQNLLLSQPVLFHAKTQRLAKMQTCKRLGVHLAALRETSNKYCKLNALPKADRVSQ